MILVEVKESSLRITFLATSSDSLRKEIDLPDEAREMAHIQEKTLEQRIAKRYNSVVLPRKFEEGDLILLCANAGAPMMG